MRRNTPFPLEDSPLTDFLKKAWKNGWLDEFSDDHFLIRAIENRLDDFVGRIQLSTNNWAMYCPRNANGEYDLATFSHTFCNNLSIKLAGMAEAFGEEAIKRFITDQLSAGKLKKYSEDAFLQALSEISILVFWLGRCQWNQTIYEPHVKKGENDKNPEASFILQTEEDTPKTIKINVEVKTPKFPSDSHNSDKILIPTVLLTEHGRSTMQAFCKDNGVTYLSPRVRQLVSFINNAADKFTAPKENELNLLYINWSYRDYPSNSFLEAASLLNNPYNGLLNYTDIAKSMEVTQDALQKISAIIVYTESLEGIMFTDYHHVWQQNGAGPRFRIYTLDQNIKQSLYKNTHEFVFRMTAMNPCQQKEYLGLIDFKAQTEEDKHKAKVFADAYMAHLTEEVVLQSGATT